MLPSRKPVTKWRAIDGTHFNYKTMPITPRGKLKTWMYGCLFLGILGVIIGCQDDERVSTEKKSASTTSTKASAPPSAQDYNNRGTAYQRAGRLQEAAAAYQRAYRDKTDVD